MDKACQKQPFDRQPGESAKAHAAAKLYFELGAQRSLEAVGQKLGKSGTLLSRWSSRWQWVARAKAYDEHLELLDLVAKQKATEAAATKWAERRAEQREAEWQLSEQLIVKAREMLTWPLAQSIVEETTDDDDQSLKQTVIVKPVRWSMADVPRILETASKLARLSTEMETSRELIELLNIDPSNLTDEELAAYLSKLDAALATRKGRS